jgi:prephenate dehydrogenase
MKTVAIFGVGLIGGSFGLALRKAGFDRDIVGVSSPRTIEAALTVGAINGSMSPEEAAANADLIYLAQPVDQILITLEAIGSIVRPECLVTDAGSTKAAIVERAGRTVAAARFLGGHPMAGKEQRGIGAADADLFRGRPYVLTPTNSEATPIEMEFRDWLGRLGANVLEMTVSEHDKTVALTSHLPQLVSTALAATLAEKSNAHIDLVFGSGLLDMTRLALSSPELWLSILSTNKKEVTMALDDFLARVTILRNALQTDSLAEQFALGNRFAGRIRKAHN